MRSLTQNELARFKLQDELEYSLEYFPDCTGFFATVQELGDMGMGTCTGEQDNKAMCALAASGFADRNVAGLWDTKELISLVLIECKASEVSAIVKIIKKGGGSLSPLERILHTYTLFEMD